MNPKAEGRRTKSEILNWPELNWEKTAEYAEYAEREKMNRWKFRVFRLFRGLKN